MHTTCHLTMMPAAHATCQLTTWPLHSMLSIHPSRKDGQLGKSMSLLFYYTWILEISISAD
jgi:hypothetical protein